MDELLASAFYIHHRGEMPQNIERIDSSEAAERAEKMCDHRETVFLDCGLIHDGISKFDHHQDAQLPCALKLVSQAFYSPEELGDLNELIELVDQVDRQGIFSLNDFSVIGQSREYMGISQSLLLRSFENSPLELMELMVPTVASMIKFEEEKIQARAWLQDPRHSRIVKLHNIHIMEYLERPPKELSRAIKAVDGDRIDQEMIHGVYSFDSKNPENRGLFRTHLGHEMLDFTKSNPSKPLFCHKNGFLLKFTPNDKEEWKIIIKESLIFS